MTKISVIIPCKNEQSAIGKLIDDLLQSNIADEIIVVNDGSSDSTLTILEKYNITIVNHHYSKGNGAAIKTGARKAQGDILVFMDADGQHSIKDIPRLLSEIDSGYDMVVGARDSKSQANTARLVGNKIYNHLASLITGHNISDLTSGFRACKRKYFLEFISLLPNGFSYPTTITMAFFRSGYSVKYIPITVNKRNGKGHLSIIKDGIRFLLIIFKVGTLYSPLKLFAPISAIIFTSGLGYYLYSYLTTERFTNMTMLMFVISIFIFVFGLISEQITMLIYLSIKEKKEGE